jgi:2',3'-cyclic-nucleotide 2'-phosphodiesterase (5'-nucleotidase family)
MEEILMYLKKSLPYITLIICIFAANTIAANHEFKLQVLHSSDNESSFQNPNTLEPKILHYATLADGLKKLAETEGAYSIHLTAGDHTIPNPYFQAAAEVPGLEWPGLADIAFYNAMGLAANGIGNHEFDDGIDTFAHMLNFADYPFVAVNLDFSQVRLQEGSPAIRIGADGSLVNFNQGKVVKSTIALVGDRKIGLIGRAPAEFFNVIEDPNTTLPGLDFIGGRDPQANQPLVSAVEQVHEQVDILTDSGVNIIILLDHAQDFTADPLSAQFLRGIDIIVAAGSTGFMAKPVADGPFNMLREGDVAGADYPTQRVDSEGYTLLVVNSDQLYTYIGNLMVTFDEAGHIINIDKRSGPIATTTEAIDALGTVLGEQLQVPSDVEAVYNELQNTPTIQSTFAEIGTTVYELNGQRADVRSRETNLGRLAADSTLWYANEKIGTPADIALKNGGGIRDTIVGPAIIRLTVDVALAFDNRITVLELTGEQLIATFENAVSRVPALDGRFPQVAGMTLEFDAGRLGIQGQASLASPSRIRTLIVTRSDGTQDTVVSDYTAQGDLSRTFVVATNSFLTTGGDGYASLAAATQLVSSEIGEQQILAEYIQEGLSGAVDIEDPPAELRVVRLDQ